MSNTRSKSTLFLIEQLIVVAVFAICAAACVRIITSAYYTARESRDVNNAIHVAESGAESYKAVGGDVGKAAAVMGGKTGSVNGASAALVYYNSKWSVCAESDADAQYVLRMTSGTQDSRTPRLMSGELTVERLDGEGDTLISFAIAAIDDG